ncbi:MAG TPA: 16S rRNA (adenine(1518)-N(6)/adenine(1519)-N(6))-dimethyltransferase RsmA [Deinococcales bacterium]|nr:16S rRNA (adenine(1518)-N(6)/adenine(1519)-N(6))-dimethyltransferase RsmA [Deinococcales bacterium]
MSGGALTDRGKVRDLLARHGLAPDRGFGQNFLVDRATLAAITGAAGLGPADTVLEFGPGLGALTVELAARAGRVLSVELDRRLVPVLEETTGHLDNVTVLNEDALDFDYSVLPDGSRLVANLPYNVATPLISRALASGRLATLTVMVQKEVAERLAARPGEAGFGAFSLITAHFADARVVRVVPPGCFFPPPKVTSAVVHLTVRSGVKPAPELFGFVYAAFSHRRKTLRRNLIMAGYPVETVLRALEAAGLDVRVRAEELGLDTFRLLHGLLPAPELNE